MSNTKTLSWDHVEEQLSRPFDPADIKWKPQTVNYKTNKALATAHADPRAYQDRLNSIVGPDNWSVSYIPLAFPFTKNVKAKKGWDNAPDTPASVENGHKIGVICQLTILGIMHASTGDEDASDENAFANAEAQAFKRACMTFGLGRYLYKLPLTEHAYDKNTRKFVQTPTLPDWAIPKQTCEGCKNDIKAGSYNGLDIPVVRLIENSQKKYQKNLCQDCQVKLSKTADSDRGKPTK